MKHYWKMWLMLLVIFGIATVAYASGGSHGEDFAFPPSLDSYGDEDIRGIGAILLHRIAQEPFNLTASLIFLCAIIHTFLTSKFLSIANRWNHWGRMVLVDTKVEVE
jgi:hypothetical protein